MSELVNIFDSIETICERLGIDPSYAYSLHIDKKIPPPDAQVATSHVTLKLYRGRDGRCKGSKYVDQTTGEVATETVEFEVSA